MLRTKRLLQVFITLTVLSATFYVTTILRPSTVSYHNTVQTATLKTSDTDVTDVGNLPEFLESKGVGTDRTLFLTIASEPYIESTINFKRGLDNFSLGEDYVVLCLDTPCLEAARGHDIIAFGGYIMKETEATDGWGYAIARAKVQRHLSKLISSWLPISPSLRPGTTSSLLMETFISLARTTRYPQCSPSQTRAGIFNSKTTGNLAPTRDCTGAVLLQPSTTSSFGRNAYGSKLINSTK